MSLANLKDIIFRNYKEGDEREVVDLYNSVFKGKYSLAQWNWEHKMNPFSHISIVLALSDSKIVGQSLSIPLSYSHEGELVRTTRVQNVMVRPDFRKRGIFLETLKRLTNYIDANQFDFIITFPNDYSLGAFIQDLDYHHIYDLPTFEMPAGLIKKDLSHDLTFQFQEDIDFSQADCDLIQFQLNQFKICNARGLDYMNWRYHKLSGRRYMIFRVYDRGQQVGLAVFKFYSGTNSIDLVEFIMVCNEIVIQASLNAIYNYCREDRPKSFNIWSMEHYPIHRILLEIGFKRTESVTHVVYKTFTSKCSNFCNKISAYYLSMGDSDVY